MKTVEEWQDLTNEEINEEIKARQNLLNQMVGWLYPSILSDEIEILLELRDDPLRRTRLIVEKHIAKS